LPKLDTLELRLNGWVTNDVLARIVEAKPGLKKLNLRECGAYTAKGLEHVASLSQLEWLDVGGHKQLRSEAMAEIGKMKQLRHLDLIMAGPLRDADLMPLSGLEELRFLGLETLVYVSGTCFETCNLPSLERLELKNNSLTVEGIRAVAKLKSLKRLYIWNFALDEFGDDSLAPLAELKGLELLSLWLPALSDATLKMAGKLQGLTALELTGCSKFTDAGFAHLRESKSLRSVRVLDCDGISEEAMDQLRKALPKCEVTRKKEPY
jgi:Leucine-rich repeat (LRR) protein